MHDSTGFIGPIIMLVFLIFVIASIGKIFTKAGESGWACLIPIYNTIVLLNVLLKIVGRPWWWLLLLFIPFVGFVIIIIVYIDLAKSVGNGGGFGVGLLLVGFIFSPIHGFGGASYQDPAAQQA